MGLRVTARGPVCYLGHSSADSGVPLMPWTFSFRQLLSCLIVAVISALIACSGHTAASRPPDVQVASVVQEDTLIYGGSRMVFNERDHT
jgi:hypothetical protein